MHLHRQLRKIEKLLPGGETVSCELSCWQSQRKLPHDGSRTAPHTVANAFEHVVGLMHHGSAADGQSAADVFGKVILRERFLFPSPRTSHTQPQPLGNGLHGSRVGDNGYIVESGLGNQPSCITRVDKHSVMDRIAGLQNLPLRSQTMKHKRTEFCRESTGPSYGNCDAVALRNMPSSITWRSIRVVRQLQVEHHRFKEVEEILVSPDEGFQRPAGH
jgi:hypothetical protein